MACAQRYEELYPEISITWEKRSLQAFADASMTVLASEYDLIIMDHPHTALAATEGGLLPYNDWLSEGYLLDQELNSVGKSCQSYQYHGKQWTLANDAATPISTWRPDLIEEYALTLPETWDDLIQLAKDGFVTISAFPVDVLMTLYPLCKALGSDLFQEDKLIEPEVIQQALNMLKELLGYCDPACLDMNPILVAEWMSQTDSPRAAYCPIAYGYSNYSRPGYAPHILKAGGLVSVDGSGLCSTLGGAGIAVSSKTKHPEACAKFSAFVASPEIQRGLYFKSGGQPGHRSAWLDDGVNVESSNFFRDTLSTLDEALIRPKFPGYMSFQDAATPVAHSCLQGAMSVQQASREINRLYQESRKNSHYETIRFPPSS